MAGAIFGKCPYCGGDLIKAKTKLVCLDCGREGRAPVGEEPSTPEIKTFKSHPQKKIQEAPKPQTGGLTELKPQIGESFEVQSLPKPQFAKPQSEIKRPKPKILKEEVILTTLKPESRIEKKVEIPKITSKKEKLEAKKIGSPPELELEEIKNFSLRKDWRDTYKLKMAYPIIVKNIKIFLQTFVANFKFNFKKVVDNLKGKKEVQ